MWYTRRAVTSSSGSPELELVAEEDEEHAAQHEATKTAVRTGSPTHAKTNPLEDVESRGTISTLESKINALKSLVQTTQQAPPVVEAPPPPSPTSAQPETESLTNIPAKWEKTDGGQWSSVSEEWATERERLSSTREEWKLKAKAIKSNLGNTTTQFDAGLATMAPLQR
ncbi:hypothetical protein FIBSPDRAFT_939543 [Athelia psychrophila]|uniref:Uncharacterized protein n=1 Tax=Athelia psychrophila TaxID=1759441 RepID=A0A167XMP5_9AGAM|nr:hypothetical protein FIBSPDRAFT_939543 [Fibularhizoctonia sp. CBS 109695]